MAGQQGINWAGIHAKLPYERTPEAKAKRDDLWRGIDVNGNGYLSLAEVDKGVRDVLGLEDVYDAKPAIMRAFQAARKAVKTKGAGGGPLDADDYIQRPEFRLLLMYLHQYFELYEGFVRIDEGDDGRVDYDEFVRARPLIERWVGGPIEDYEGEFARIDRNGGGQILFSEFASWGIQKSLDLEEDDE